MAKLLVFLQECINGAADQLRHRQASIRGQIAQCLQLLVRKVEVHPVHTPIIHTFCLGATTTIGLLLATTLSAGQEMAVPDKPVVSTVTSYQIVSFSLEREPDWRFTIVYKDSNGTVYRDEHYGPASRPNPAGGEPIANPDGADSFLKQMNTANFSTTSLMRRLLQHLVQHGKIPAATVTGTPETEQ